MSNWNQPGRLAVHCEQLESGEYPVLGSIMPNDDEMRLFNATGQGVEWKDAGNLRWIENRTAMIFIANTAAIDTLKTLKTWEPAEAGTTRRYEP